MRSASSAASAASLDATCSRGSSSGPAGRNRCAQEITPTPMPPSDSAQQRAFPLRLAAPPVDEGQSEGGEDADDEGDDRQQVVGVDAGDLGGRPGLLIRPAASPPRSRARNR